MQLSATSGQGNGSLSVNVARNEQSSTRTGAVLVNDQRLTVSQEGQPCNFELRGPEDRISFTGGRGSIEVSTAAGCAWTASATSSWLRVLTSSGSGPGTVEYEADRNSGAAPRDASITVGNRQITIVQAAAGSAGPPVPLPPNCAPALSTQNVEIAQAGQSASVTLTINGACDWTAAAGPSDTWLNVSPASGRGGGTVTLRAERNDGASRTATVMIAQLPVTVTQPGSCAVTIGSSSETYAPGGGRGAVRVDTASGCRWTASSDRPEWAAMTQASGEGGGEARYTVSGNASTSSRTAVITIGSNRHTVTQRGCTFDVTPPTRNLPAQGGSGSVQVRPDASSCTWSVSGAISGMTVTPASGTGEGNFSYNVPANPDPGSRTIRLRVGGDTHIITQDGIPAPTQCTYQLESGSRNFPAVGGPGAVRVTGTPQGCTGTWSVSGVPDWVQVGNGSGAGSGEFSYTVTRNATTAPRNATLTVAGQSYQITQEGEPAPTPTCAYQLESGSRNFPAAGGPGAVRVTGTPPGCTGTWTVSGVPDWVQVGNGSGAGSGEFSYTVTRNTGTAPRNATLTVAGQSYQITQQGEPAPTPSCTFQLDSASRSFPASGGPATVVVTGTPPGCVGTWQVVGAPEWVQVSGGSGSGSGQFSYNVAEHRGADTRSATLTVGGQSHVITQQGVPPAQQACTFQFDQPTRNFPASGSGGNVTVRVLASPSGCVGSWSVSGAADWTPVTDGSGSGGGQFAYAVLPNATTIQRSVTLSLAGGNPTHVITQDAAAPQPPPPQLCTYLIDPTERNVDSIGALGIVRVETGRDCAWSVTPGADWVRLASTGGTGPGSVGYGIEPNRTGAPRMTLVTIAGHGFTVRQQ